MQKTSIDGRHAITTFTGAEFEAGGWGFLMGLTMPLVEQLTGRRVWTKRLAVTFERHPGGWLLMVTETQKETTG